EFVVTDPAQYTTLTDYAGRCGHDVVSMVGLELQHVTDREPAFDMRRNVLEQRRHVWFNSAICKPALTGGPLDWSPGFHCMAKNTVFDDLYMIHLRYFDRDAGIHRLHRSRNQPWSHPAQAPHQRVGDEDWLRMVAEFGAVSRLSDIPAEASAVEVRACLDAVIASRAGRERETYRIDLSIHGPALWRIPERFSGIF
ncbi:MAG TPA: hypothetical protein VF286_12160, partial [Acidiphilium sp.]